MTIPEIIMFESNRIWRTYPGGRILDQMEGKINPEDSHFPEDWIASTTRAVNRGREDTEEGLSRIIINNFKIDLPSLFRKYPYDLLGKYHYDKYGANTQFLLKFLDSAVRLHIQAHPTIPFAQKYLNSNSGKTEAYVILEVREEVKDPYIYLGFQKLPDRKVLREIILKQQKDKLLSCFEKIPVKPGDVFIVPGGIPHAIGEGVFMIEIMEPTDWVVRLEFECGGFILPEESRFMGRGVDFALDMINFSLLSEEDIRKNLFCTPGLSDMQEGGREEVLIDTGKTNCFSVSRLSVSKTFVKSSESFYAGIVTKGDGMIKTKNEQRPLKRGDKFFIPFNQKEVSYISKNEMEVVLTFPPQ